MVKIQLKASLPALARSSVESDEDLRSELLSVVKAVGSAGALDTPDALNAAYRIINAIRDQGRDSVLLDSFAGGGSIPLESARLGLETVASDLNPVAFLILKSLLEVIPGEGEQLLIKYREAAASLREITTLSVSSLYSGKSPVAYIWSREAICESPRCGIHFPLLNNLWLRKKSPKPVFLRYQVTDGPDGPFVDVIPVEADPTARIQRPIVSRGNATCPRCGTVLPVDRVRAYLAQRKGGARFARMLAVVEYNPAVGVREYRRVRGEDLEAARRASALLETMERDPSTRALIPDEPLPPTGTLGFRVQRYGLQSWSDLFVPRQLVLLATLAGHVRKVSDSPQVQLLLALALDKCLRHWNTGAKWHSGSETVAGSFGMQTLPMSWMWPESYPWAQWAGNYDDAIESIGAVIQHGLSKKAGTTVLLADAAELPLPDESVDIWFTDPPYYDAIPYADLSDFFFVWLKRFLGTKITPSDPFDATNPLTPKERECVENPGRKDPHGAHDSSYFEQRVTLAFLEGRRVLRPAGIGCVVFAHKSTEGWEALLSAIVGSGWTVTASWPIATERGARLRARESAALESSIHVVIRPRDQEQVGDWAEVLRELPKRVGDWMERLQSEGVRGADLVFACIGPALEIFSRYKKVETAEGKEVPLKNYLEKVWEVVGRTALGQILGTAEAKARNSAVGALEEDARLTALFLWTLQSTEITSAKAEIEEGEVDDDEEDDGEWASERRKKGYSLPFDIVRRFAQPLGIHLDASEGRVIETKKGIVRLLALQERASSLFGGKGSEAVAAGAERLRRGPVQAKLFPQPPSAKEGRGEKRMEKNSKETRSRSSEMTTLDRVHAAMLLQAAGQSGALRDFLNEEMRRGPQFLRLANALSALYPKESEEKRLLDAVLLATPRK